MAQTNIPRYRDASLDFETRAADLVEQMTLEEKISQLGNVSAAIPLLGIQKYNWWNECLHGVARAGTATVFPQAIGLAATFDRDMMYQTACVISDEARAKHHEAIRNKDYGEYKGLTFWSPNINIFRDPRWGRGHETYGEDPYLTGQMGIQFVRGLQGDDPKYFKVIATAKHFAVHSGPEPERHRFNVVVNPRDLWETYLPAFYDVVVTGKAYSVMSAYNRVDGESASASWMLLEDILRKQWSFDGYVVSDCGAVHDIYEYHEIVNNGEEAAAIAIRRGCDLNCGGVYQTHLLDAVNNGLVDEGEIDLAAYRLMLTRMKLGMFDPPEQVPFAQIPFEVNDCEKHDTLALKMSQKSMTLLKNDGILPLDKSKIKKIAVVGPNAESIQVLHGNYHGNASRPVTVLDGIRRKVDQDCQIVYTPGCGLVESSDSYDQALETVAQADVAIFIGGLDAELEGEELKVKMNGFLGGDRTKIELPRIQLKTLKSMQKTGTPVVFVLLSGSAIAFDGIDEDIPAILLGWYPGQRGGDAVADVLFGDYNPAGRLPVTFYASTKELGDFRDYNMRAGKGLTYRYYKGQPIYPFGHGLSYTLFEYSDIKISHTQINSNDDFTVSVQIKNVGAHDGEEVVQLYVHDVESKLPMPIKQLRGFERITLKKGEQEKVTFKLNAAEDLRYYNAQHRQYAVDLGEFEIQIGASSKDIRLTKVITVR